MADGERVIGYDNEYIFRLPQPAQQQLPDFGEPATAVGAADTGHCAAIEGSSQLSMVLVIRLFGFLGARVESGWPFRSR